MSKRIEIAGQTFGLWTVVDYHSKNRWKCRCRCGAEKLIQGASLRGGKSRGCLSCRTASPYPPGRSARGPSRLRAKALCSHCGLEFFKPHGLSRYCSPSCKITVAKRAKRERAAEMHGYRRRLGEIYYPRQCINCSDQFKPKTARDRHCHLCKQKKVRWTEDPVAALLRSARSRSLACDLTREWFERVWKEQAGRCALTGEPMRRERSPRAASLGTDGRKVSIDRLDGRKGYVQGNCRLVCVVANLMRHQLSDSDLLAWCQLVVGHLGRDREKEFLSALDRFTSARSFAVCEAGQ